MAKSLGEMISRLKNKSWFEPIVKNDKAIRWIGAAILTGIIFPVVVSIIIRIITPNGPCGTMFSETYEPPHMPGVVYAVINKKDKSNICVGYSWGDAKKDITVDLSTYKGVILSLNHDKADSYPLIVTSDGHIISILQYQDKEVPEQYHDNQYKFIKL